IEIKMKKNLMAKLSELARKEIVEEDLNDEINNFFQSPPEQRLTDPIKSSPKQRLTDPIKSSPEQRSTDPIKSSPKQRSTNQIKRHKQQKKQGTELISNTGNISNRNHICQLYNIKISENFKQMCHAEEDLDYIPISEDDSSDYALSDIEDQNPPPLELPQVDKTFAESMICFSNMCVEVQTKSKLRQILNTTSFLNKDEPYNRKTHYDADLTDFKDPNKPLQKQHLESWFDINVWSLIIDHSLRNVIGMETVRKESSSDAVSMRKNRKRAHTRHRKVECKKMGYRMDGILRMYIDNVEYRAMEVAKKFETTKLLSDGYKLGKLCIIYLYALAKKSILRKQDSPKGYVLILKREKLLEVSAKVDKIKDLIRVLANVWILK
ncbi:4096_t:CDS:10, partial [Racocetra persica]